MGEIGLGHVFAEEVGRHPLLELPKDPYSCWRWTPDEGHCAVISYALPGCVHAGVERRLRLTATGFAAFGDGFWQKPSLIIDRGMLLAGPCCQSRRSSQ